MTFKETMATLFSTAEGTYYKWKKEERPIIKLLDKYFSKEELEEFLSTGKINKLENLNSYSLSSWMSFLKKIEKLAGNEFNVFNYFAEFILHYILKSFEPGPNGEEYWIGQCELNSFQKDFIEFLFCNYGITSNEKFFFGSKILNDMKYLTTFIYSFDDSNLLFLNMNIEDNFKTLQSFANSNSKFDYDQKNTLSMFEYNLLKCLKSELNKEGNLEDLISEYKLKCIKELEEK